MSGTDVQAPWHGALKTMDFMRQSSAGEGRKIVGWLSTQASSHNSQCVVDDKVS